jgi:hypothetical protein
VKIEVKQLEIKYSDLRIGRDTVAKMLRFGEGEIPPHFIDLIDHELDMASTLCKISGGYLVAEPVLVDKVKQQIKLGGVNFYVGKNISIYLKKAEKLALLLCTAGPEIEVRSQHLMKEGHFPEGFILDTIGSIVVESAMEIIHESLSQDMRTLGLKVSNRYSPGYCSWDVSEQKKLFLFFPEKFSGITLSDSSLMNPIKSISGIVGISKDIKRMSYMCSNCTMINCTFRGLEKG